MKHLIIGVGVVGDATYCMLDNLGEDVWAMDKNETKLKGKQKSIVANLDFYDYIWICTAEWNVEDVMPMLRDIDVPVIIRSTTLPGFTNQMQVTYGIKRIAHVPEFLREKWARMDAMNPDRVVIGCHEQELAYQLFKLLLPLTTNIVSIDTTESEIVKLVSNAYLSTQISFWNEIKWICREAGVNIYNVVKGVTLDHRVSSYGHQKFGKFGGFCLPKDLASLILYAQGKCRLLKAVQEVNDNESEDAQS